MKTRTPNGFSEGPLETRSAVPKDAIPGGRTPSLAVSFEGESLQGLQTPLLRIGAFDTAPLATGPPLGGALMSIYLGPITDEKRRARNQTENGHAADSRPPYAPGTILAAAVLSSMALLFFGMMIPTVSFRFDGIFTSPLRFALAMHDLVMWLAHAGMLACGIALISRRPRVVRPALFLVGLIWGANLGWQMLFSQFELILPTAGFALFTGMPLVYLMRTAPRAGQRPGQRPGAARRWLLLAECVVAFFVLAVTASIALERPIGELLEHRAAPQVPAGSESAPARTRRAPGTLRV